MARGALLVALALLTGCVAPGAQEIGTASCGENESCPDEEPAREPEPEEPESEPEPEPEPEPEREPEPSTDESSEPTPERDEPESPAGEPSDAPASEDPSPAPETPTAPVPAEETPTTDEPAAAIDPVAAQTSPESDGASEEPTPDAEPATEPAAANETASEPAAENDTGSEPAAANETVPEPAAEDETTSGPAPVSEPDPAPAEVVVAEPEEEVEAEPAPTGTIIFSGNATSGAGGTAVESPQRAEEAPDVNGFALSDTLANNSGLAEVLVTGRILDADGEDSIRAIEVRGGGVPGADVLGANHTIRAVERAQREEPLSWTSDGFRVWDEVEADGALDFAYRLLVPQGQAAGLYVVRAIAVDDTEASGYSSGITLEVIDYARVQVQIAPVDAEGRSLSGQGWGSWTATAGARNVTATNYLKIVNAGTLENVTVRLAFTRAFAGESDARYKIPIANNLELAWWEDVTPGSTRPSEGVFTYVAGSDDGFADLTFTGAGNVIYVSYRFKQLPPVLAIQEYSAPFTLSEAAS